MHEEYEIIFITEEGRAIKNNKTGKIYHSEFEIIEEKNKEIDRLNNIINGIEAYCNMAITMNFNMNNSKLQEQIVEDYTNVLNKLKELKDSD